MSDDDFDFDDYDSEYGDDDFDDGSPDIATATIEEPAIVAEPPVISSHAASNFLKHFDNEIEAAVTAPSNAAESTNLGDLFDSGNNTTFHQQNASQNLNNEDKALFPSISPSRSAIHGTKGSQTERIGRRGKLQLPSPEHRANRSQTNRRDRDDGTKAITSPVFSPTPPSTKIPQPSRRSSTFLTDGPSTEEKVPQPEYPINNSNSDSNNKIIRSRKRSQSRSRQGSTSSSIVGTGLTSAEFQMLGALQRENIEIAAKLRRSLQKIDKLEYKVEKQKKKLITMSRHTPARKPLYPGDQNNSNGGTSVLTKRQMALDAKKIKIQKAEIISLKKQLALYDDSRMRDLEELLDDRERVIEKLRADFQNLIDLHKKRVRQRQHLGRDGDDGASRLEQLEGDTRMLKHKNREYSIKLRQAERNILNLHQEVTELKRQKKRDAKLIEEYRERLRRRGENVE